MLLQLRPWVGSNDGKVSPSSIIIINRKNKCWFMYVNVIIISRSLKQLDWQQRTAHAASSLNGMAHLYLTIISEPLMLPHAGDFEQIPQLPLSFLLETYQDLLALGHLLDHALHFWEQLHHTLSTQRRLTVLLKQKQRNREGKCFNVSPVANKNISSNQPIKPHNVLQKECPDLSHPTTFLGLSALL